MHLLVSPCRASPALRQFADEHDLALFNRQIAALDQVFQDAADHLAAAAGPAGDFLVRDALGNAAPAIGQRASQLVEQARQAPIDIDESEVARIPRGHAQSVDHLGQHLE